jgi:predicted outer membrane repeat protein
MFANNTNKNDGGAISLWKGPSVLSEPNTSYSALRSTPILQVSTHGNLGTVHLEEVSNPQRMVCNITGCTFMSNKATNTGGAIHSSMLGVLAIRDTEFKRNEAGEGNAIYAELSTTVLFPGCKRYQVLVNPEKSGAATLDNCDSNSMSDVQPHSFDCCTMIENDHNSKKREEGIEKWHKEVFWACLVCAGFAAFTCIATVLTSRRRKETKSRSSRRKPKRPGSAVGMSLSDADSSGAPSRGGSVRRTIGGSISDSHRVDSPWKIDSAKLKIREVIGGGNYGEIFRGFYGKDAVAIKKLVMELDQEDDTKSVMSEAQLLWDLRHPRILVFFGMCKRKTSANTEIYLVMELCVGSLDLYLEDRKKSRKKRRAKEKQKQREAKRGAENDGQRGVLLGSGAKDATGKVSDADPPKVQPTGVKGQLLPVMTECQFWQWMVEIAEGMLYIHSKRVIHRDMKPHNVFVCSDGHVKIGDFGLSRVVHRQTGNTLKQDGRSASVDLTANLGTPSYMAPELLTQALGRDGKRASIHIDGEAADVYAFGIIMNALWTKQAPYVDVLHHFKSVQDLIQQVVRGLRPGMPEHLNCPQALAALIERCWHADPKFRPTFSEVLDMLRSCCYGMDIFESGESNELLHALQRTRKLGHASPAQLPTSSAPKPEQRPSEQRPSEQRLSGSVNGGHAAQAEAQEGIVPHCEQSSEVSCGSGSSSDALASGASAASSAPSAGGEGASGSSATPVKKTPLRTLREFPLADGTDGIDGADGTDGADGDSDRGAKHQQQMKEELRQSYQISGTAGDPASTPQHRSTQSVNW